ncbi:MAG: diacylglycerol kinase family lipid kinase [Enterobacterales bacterium]|nr:diacylglycerol kinase family lipid kinase [Enterobacterales bacterium]
MHLLIIYNPQAGGGRAKKLLPQVKNYLKQQSIEATFLLTTHCGHAKQLAAEADLSAYDALIASGGDGTQFEVLNGYYANQSNNKPPMGLIPNGTGNAFIRDLGLRQTDWKKAIDIIKMQQIKKLDVGHFTAEGQGYYFLNIVGMGFVADVAELSVPLKWLGNTAYTIATLIKMIRLRSQKMIIEVDGERLEREAIFAEVANSTFTGTTFLMAPKARLDDGLLDLVLLNKTGRLKLLKLFSSIYDGSHINYPEVEYIQAQSIKIEEEKPGKLIPDGEILGRTPVEFKCLAADLDFFMGYLIKNP